MAQLYVHDVESTLQRPVRELRAFDRLVLEAGESGTATFSINMRSFAFFDADRQCWVAEAGAYELQAGASSEDIRATTTVTLTADWIESAADAWMSDIV